MTVAPDFTLTTHRLLLRATAPRDVDDFVRIQSNWRVARMLRLADFPPTPAAMNAWLASHAVEWREGTAFRFAVVFKGRTIGCVDIDEIRGGRGELGYWLDEAAWGQGLAFESAWALMAWGLGSLGLTGLDSGCAGDNPASAAVLTRLGFEKSGEERLWSNPRKDWITQLKFSRQRP